MKKWVPITLSLMCVMALSAQSALPPPFPRTNATKLLDTDRITVWDIVWPKGQPTAMHRHMCDQVGTYYARGGRLTARLQMVAHRGNATQAQPRSGVNAH